MIVRALLKVNLSRRDNPGTQKAPGNNAIQLKLFNAIIKIPMCDTSLCSNPPSLFNAEPKKFSIYCNPHIHIEPNNTVTTPCFKTLHYTRADFVFSRIQRFRDYNPSTSSTNHSSILISKSQNINPSNSATLNSCHTSPIIEFDLPHS